MILADTSIWVDHFRRGDPDVNRQLDARNLLMHPLVALELALGHLSQRAEVLMLLDGMPAARIARLDEVRKLVESRALFGRGMGAVDVQLLASALISQPCRFWTRDKRLRAAAVKLGMDANLP